jgi:hypothetical protein
MEISNVGKELTKAGCSSVAVMPPELALLPMLPVDEFSSVTKAREYYERNGGSYPPVLVFSYSHKSLYWVDTMYPVDILHFKFLHKLRAYASK